MRWWHPGHHRPGAGGAGGGAGHHPGAHLRRGHDLRLESTQHPVWHLVVDFKSSNMLACHQDLFLPPNPQASPWPPSTSPPPAGWWPWSPRVRPDTHSSTSSTFTLSFIFSYFSCWVVVMKTSHFMILRPPQARSWPGAWPPGRGSGPTRPSSLTP